MNVLGSLPSPAAFTRDEFIAPSGLGNLFLSDPGALLIVRRFGA